MRTLRFGAQGPDVEWLQKRLGIVDDGDFGQETFAAVWKFQEFNGLVPDGVVGPRTWAVLKPESIAPAPESSAVRGSHAWYLEKFNTMVYDTGAAPAIRAVAQRVARSKSRYLVLEREIGCPWYFPGPLHSLEASSDFSRVLHNGERIIGTGRKTVLVPAGRGPFKTWEAAAIDALKIKNYHLQTSWTLAEMLARAERFNGMGYMKYHPEQDSPYVWAKSNHTSPFGKYVADGHYSSSAPAEEQVGFAPLIKELERMGEIELPKQAAA